MNKINWPGVSKPVMVRSVLTVIVALNILLGYMGMHLIPVTDAEVGNLVDGGIVVITAGVWAWGWWKNNSFTVNAQKADAVLKQLNEEG